MESQREHLSTSLRPGQVVHDLLRVHSVVEQTGRRGRTRFLSMILADGTGPLDTIAGPGPFTLAPAQMVRVRGCVLIRQSQPILVVTRLNS